jgi:hypothetical protein
MFGVSSRFDVVRDFLTMLYNRFTRMNPECLDFDASIVWKAQVIPVAGLPQLYLLFGLAMVRIHAM